VSNALEKSNEITMTSGLDRSRFVTVCRTAMIAASIEPVGWNANWSKNVRFGGGLKKVRYKKVRTTNRSTILVRIGVIEIGRKSATCLGAVVFGIGRMVASFHCSGTVEVTSERLKRYAMGWQKTGALHGETRQADRPYSLPSVADCPTLWIRASRTRIQVAW